MSEWDIYDDMNFYSSSEEFIIEPRSKQEMLIIHRISGDISIQQKSSNLPDVCTKRICGVLGLIKLLGGRYLLVATHRIFIGLINNRPIWRLAGYDIIPYIPSYPKLSQEQKEHNEKYLKMIKKTLDTPFLYFSYSHDLSHTLQRLHSMPPEFLTYGLFERAAERFIWNGYILKNFENEYMKKYCLPLVLGFVSISTVFVNGFSFTWGLISRRSVQRAGTRLFCRGIDEDGNCANYVETEQIIEYNGDKISYVQTRGSIPIFWRQLPNLKYKPKPLIIDGKDHAAACTKHFESQLIQYGRQVAVNLINQHGAESLLGDAFANIVSQLSLDVRYEAFDFHSECKKNRWDRLHRLIDRLAHEQDDFSTFHLHSDGTLLSVQDGVFRTNCIDCLDRTNVVQSLLAKRSLIQTLHKLGIMSNGQNIESFSEFENVFKGVWADNADMISIQYSGTGALKTDFTRTGKRTPQGLLKDGAIALTRYCLNNFTDGFRQDSIDLFLGNYKILENELNTSYSPLVTKRTWRYTTLPSALIFSVTMFLLTVVYPHEYRTENLLFLLIWGSVSVVATSGILCNGVEFVDWPKLVTDAKNLATQKIC